MLTRPEMSWRSSKAIFRGYRISKELLSTDCLHLDIKMDSLDKAVASKKGTTMWVGPSPEFTVLRYTSSESGAVSWTSSKYHTPGML